MGRSGRQGGPFALKVFPLTLLLFLVERLAVPPFPSSHTAFTRLFPSVHSPSLSPLSQNHIQTTPSKLAGAPWATIATPNNGTSLLFPVRKHQCQLLPQHASDACPMFHMLNIALIIPPVLSPSIRLTRTPPQKETRLSHHAPAIYHQVSNAISTQLPNWSSSLAPLVPSLSVCTSGVPHSALQVA